MDKLLLELLYRMSLAVREFADLNTNGLVSREYATVNLLENMRRITAELRRLTVQVDRLGKEDEEPIK